MGSILIRQVDERTKSRLKSRAAHNRRSMEEEAREILKAAVATEPTDTLNLAEAIHRRFAALGGIDLPEVPDGPIGELPDFK
jgi:antitoxin FitA